MTHEEASSEATKGEAMNEVRLYPSGRYVVCAGPENYFPPPGSVGLDKRAKCPWCGRRVSVTVRGNYRKHTKAAR